MSAKKIRILLVDDHEIVRAGIKRMLSEIDDFEICAEAQSGEEAIQKVNEHKPDFVMMDLKMPGIGGLEATRRIVHSHHNIKILILTACIDPIYPSRLLQVGARGYITKETGLPEMVKAIRNIMAEQHYISSEIAHKLAVRNSKGQTDNPFASLSERELQVALMVAEGQAVSDIAKKLYLSIKTVNSYRYRIFDKLAVSNDVELTLMAVRHGMIDVDEHQQME